MNQVGVYLDICTLPTENDRGYIVFDIVCLVRNDENMMSK